MDTGLIPKVIEMWCAVNIDALLVLAVLSYVSSVATLNGLDRLDRRLRPRVANPVGNAAGADEADVDGG